MSAKLRGFGAILLAAALLALMGLILRPAEAAPPGLITPTPLPQAVDAPRSTSGQGDLAPNITAIDSPAPQCYRPEPYTDRCYIQWAYQETVATSSNYIISLTVSIDNRVRAYYAGFFQTSLYAPSDLTAPGFQVACGLPGASGAGPTLGNTYTWKVQARESSGLQAQNTGRVSCPADVVPATPLDSNGPTTGLTRVPYAFTVATSPNASLPVTYTWTVSGQAGAQIAGGRSNTQTYAWNTPGLQHLLIEIANPAGVVTTTQAILILPHTIYLPLAASMVK